MTTVYNFVGVLLTVTMLNKMMSANKTFLNQNAKFFICVGFLVYLFGQTIPVLFSLYQLKMSVHFRMQMYYLIDVFVAAMYLLFAYALLLIARQTKQGKNRTFRTVINGKKKEHDYHLQD